MMNFGVGRRGAARRLIDAIRVVISNHRAGCGKRPPCIVDARCEGAGTAIADSGVVERGRGSSGGEIDRFPVACSRSGGGIVAGIAAIYRIILDGGEVDRGGRGGRSALGGKAGIVEIDGERGTGLEFDYSACLNGEVCTRYQAAASRN